tara:strand:- start:43 stop:552 length:510 start_codon:yes stop_codon:yes gene_type:complete
MAKKNLSQLETERDNLIKEVDKMSVALAAQTYDIDFVEASNVNKVMTHLDKNYKWTVKNAALLINLYDSLKQQKNLISKDKENTATVSLKMVPLNTLYSALTTLEGTGVAQAKAFTGLLTNVGSQISDAMQSMQGKNKEIQALHVSLAELDAQIDVLNVETVTPDEISQ